MEAICLDGKRLSYCRILQSILDPSNQFPQSIPSTLSTAVCISVPFIRPCPSMPCPTFQAYPKSFPSFW